MSELTPITRKEHFLAKAGGQSVETPTPITREETFLQGIIDNGGGGGGGGGATVLTATVSDGTATLPCTAAELASYMQSGVVIVKAHIVNPEDPTDTGDLIYVVHSSQYYSDDSFTFTSYGFEITCSSGEDIPSWSVL